MAMFMGQQGEDPVVDLPEGELQLPELIVNNHLLFWTKGKQQRCDQTAHGEDLLDYYTAEQLRAFLGLGLGIRASASGPSR